MTISLLLILITGCKVNDKELFPEGDELPVRILTSIDIEYPNSVSESTPSTREAVDEENRLVIAHDGSATELNPAVINPKIELKRTLAKTELNLVNIDTETGEVYDNTKEFGLDRVTISNIYDTGFYDVEVGGFTINRSAVSVLHPEPICFQLSIIKRVLEPNKRFQYSFISPKTERKCLLSLWKE